MRNPREVAWGLDQLLEDPGLGEDSHFEVRFGSFAPDWRAQLNPLGGDRASLWTFVRGVPQEELGSYATRAREVFPGARMARVLQERRGADPAFVLPGRIAGDGVMACGAAAAQGGLEYGARAGLLAGDTAARAIRVGDVSRQTLRAYERAWRRETSWEHRAVRWGMEALRHLPDTELDDLFAGLSGASFGEDEVAAMLRGDPRAALRRTGARRAGRLLPALARGWTRAARRHRT